MESVNKLIDLNSKDFEIISTKNFTSSLRFMNQMGLIIGYVEQVFLNLFNGL